MTQLENGAYIIFKIVTSGFVTTLQYKIQELKTSIIIFSVKIFFERF